MDEVEYDEFDHLDDDTRQRMIDDMLGAIRPWTPPARWWEPDGTVMDGEGQEPLTCTRQDEEQING